MAPAPKQATKSATKTIFRILFTSIAEKRLASSILISRFQPWAENDQGRKSKVTAKAMTHKRAKVRMFNSQIEVERTKSLLASANAGLTICGRLTGSIGSNLGALE
jgi:hypothetical protein